MTSGAKWSIAFRYSQLYEYNEQWKKEVGSRVKLPQFPGKEIIAEGLLKVGVVSKGKEFSDRRAKALEKYLVAMSEIPQVRELKSWQKFLLINNTNLSVQTVSSTASVHSGHSEREVDLVFGVPLETLVAHPCNQGDCIPRIMRTCIEYLKEHALQQEGLFRVPAMAAELERLKLVINRGNQAPDFSTAKDRINVVGGILKQYLRELPEPLLSFSLYSSFIQLSDAPKKEKRAKIPGVLAKLSKTRRETVKYLLEFLKELSRHSEANMMTRANIAVVFGPILLADMVNDMSSMVFDSKSVSTLTIFLLASPIAKLFAVPRPTRPAHGPPALTTVPSPEPQARPPPSQLKPPVVAPYQLQQQHVHTKKNKNVMPTVGPPPVRRDTKPKLEKALVQHNTPNNTTHTNHTNNNNNNNNNKRRPTGGKAVFPSAPAPQLPPISTTPSSRPSRRPPTPSTYQKY